jgi:hypothetical protein
VEQSRQVEAQRQTMNALQMVSGAQAMLDQ